MNETTTSGRDGVLRVETGGGDDAAGKFPPGLALEADRAANCFRASSRRTVDEIMDVGLALLEVRDVAEKRAFARWMKKEFGAEARTAENYMQVARIFSRRRNIVAGLPLTVAYRLAAPTLPAATRDRILERLSCEPALDPTIVRNMMAEGSRGGHRPAGRRPGPAKRSRRTVSRSDVDAAFLIASLAGSRRLELAAHLTHCKDGLGFLIREALEGRLEGFR